MLECRWKERDASTYLSDVEPFKTVTNLVIKNNRTGQSRRLFFIVITLHYWIKKDWVERGSVVDFY